LRRIRCLCAADMLKAHGFEVTLYDPSMTVARIST
jgi:hypothetical protein